MDKKRTTIYDIAKEVGLTANTVSRVLNDKGYISKKTRERVMAAAKEMNYVPNDLARSLKTSETKQILLAVPFVKDSFNFDLICAVQDVVQSNNYSLLLMYTELDEKKEMGVIECLMRNQADGLILVTTNISDAIIDKIRKANKPCVVCCFSKYDKNHGDLPFDYVSVDTQRGIYYATSHLIEQGHTDIAYIGPKTDVFGRDERYAGFELAMEEAGLPINPDYNMIGGHMEITGYECGKRLIELGKLPTAICAGTDQIVLGLYRVFEQNKIAIPQDVSIVGMDNIDICTLVKPKISSVYVAQAQIGTVASNIILDRLSGHIGEDYKNITIQPRLIVRESSLNFHQEG